MAEPRHRRSRSYDLEGPRSAHPPPPPSPPSPSAKRHSFILSIPIPIPTPALVESVAGAAHYSGNRVDPETSPRRRQSSHEYLENHTYLKADHQRVMMDLQELYACRPTLEIFQRSWHNDAVFEDPLSKCRGFDEYAAQWFAMPVFFFKSETILFRVMSSTRSPNRLVYSQTQEYTTRLFKRKKRIESVIVVDLDDDEKIIKFVDLWSGEELPTRYGAHLLRIVVAKITPWLIHVPRRQV